MNEIKSQKKIGSMYVPNCLITSKSLKDYNQQSEIVRNFDSFNWVWTNLEGC